eukprot:5762672-Pleurochrysis_carterae.AAC.1
MDIPAAVEQADLAATQRRLSTTSAVSTTSTSASSMTQSTLTSSARVTKWPTALPRFSTR